VGRARESSQGSGRASWPSGKVLTVQQALGDSAAAAENVQWQVGLPFCRACPELVSEYPSAAAITPTLSRHHCDVQAFQPLCHVCLSHSDLSDSRVMSSRRGTPARRALGAAR
jgi:hypothetical protein